MELYTGKMGGAKQAYYDIVMRNLKSARMTGKGKHYTMDNLFSSPALFLDLYLDEDTKCTGTARQNRKGMPQLTVGPNKGDASYTTVGVTRGEKKCVLSATLWQDKKPVYFISAASEVGPESETGKGPRFQRDGEGVYAQPAVRVRYVEYMDGVDVADALRAYCGLMLKRFKRWWFTLWVGVVYVCLANGYVIYNDWLTERGEKAVSTKGYRPEVSAPWPELYRRAATQTLTARTVFFFAARRVLVPSRRRQLGHDDGGFWCQRNPADLNRGLRLSWARPRRRSPRSCGRTALVRPSSAT